MKTIQIRWTRHVRCCWRSKDELISNMLLWTLSRGEAKVGQLARTYLPQFCADSRCTLEDLLGPLDNRDEWWERVREIRASSTTWWHLVIFLDFINKPFLNVTLAHLSRPNCIPMSTFLFELTILPDHLVYEELIFAVVWFFFASFLF